MEYGQAKSALLASARERRAQVVKELTELEAVIGALNGKGRMKQTAATKRTSPVLRHKGGRHTLTGRIVIMLKDRGPMTSRDITQTLISRGVRTTKHSVEGAVSRAGKAGVLSHVPHSRLWALGDTTL